MEVESYEHGVPCWVDLGSPDPARAAEFYSALFGWSVAEGPPEAGGYRLAELRGKPVAGIGPQMNPGAPPAWNTYVNVDDADSITGTIRANGGQVLMEPFDVLDVGRMGVFADPTGAVFSAWQARAHIGSAIVNEPGTYSWNELVTTDVAKATEFYPKVFGWQPMTHAADSPMPYAEWQLGGRSVAGMMAKPPMIPPEVPSFWGVYFTVTDTDATVERVKELGGNLVMGPMDIEPGRFAVLTDPTGAAFNVITMNPEQGSA